MAAKNLYFIEITDTFCGEANYSWITRHVVKAKTQRGAVVAMSRRSGMQWRGVGCDRWDSKSGATCMFVTEYEPEYYADYNFGEDDR